MVTVTCPNYGCGVVQALDDVGRCHYCTNCGFLLWLPSPAGRDRQSVGLLAAMTMIAALTWYVTQKAM